MHPLLSALSQRGWTVHESTATQPLLPASVAQRYPILPAEVVTFLSSLEVCCNQLENAWFLTAEDLAREEDVGFRWNEYERMALEDLDDPVERSAITTFWDSHFPFMMAVHSDYDYLAIRLTADSFGNVVHGYAPEWEEPSTIAESFAEFLEALTSAAAAPQAGYPLDVFL
jgi:hypothetical protein